MNIVAQINAITSLRLFDALHVSYDVADQRVQNEFYRKYWIIFESLSLVATVVVDWVVDFTVGFVVNFVACVGCFGFGAGFGTGLAAWVLTGFGFELPFFLISLSSRDWSSSERMLIDLGILL